MSSEYDMKCACGDIFFRLPILSVRVMVNYIMPFHTILKHVLKGATPQRHLYFILIVMCNCNSTGEETPSQKNKTK